MEKTNVTNYGGDVTISVIYRHEARTKIYRGHKRLIPSSTQILFPYLHLYFSLSLSR